MSNDVEVFRLTHKTALQNAITEIRSHDLDGTYEVIVRKIAAAKTLAQLGGLFGCWKEYLANETGESVIYIHRMWKAKYLSPIYHDDIINEKPCIDEVYCWAEALHAHRVSGDMEKYKACAKRISLKWANLDQTRRYMNAIEADYQSQEMPLPVLDKFRKYYK